MRGGLAAKFSREHYLWRGANRTRSFAEFRLMRKLLAQKLPVPRPLAAFYVRDGLRYRAAILMERLEGKIELDLVTARRLFTLVYALHWKG